MRIIEGWHIETKEGESFRLLITEGHYAWIGAALDTYRGPFYLVKTTGVKGSEMDIINLVTEENEVKILDVQRLSDNYVADFRVVDIHGNTIFTFKDTRVFIKRVYEM